MGHRARGHVDTIKELMLYRLFIWTIGDLGDKAYVKCILWESRRIVYSETKSNAWTGNTDDVERIRRWASGVNLISEDAT